MLFSFLVSLFATDLVAAESPVQIVTMYNTYTSDDDPNDGKRVPPRPVTIQIDYINRTISGIQKSDVMTYEVWNSDGEFVIFSSPDDSDLVEFLSGVTGSCQLRIIMPFHSYVGYITR